MSITVVNSVAKSLNHPISISVIFFVFVLSLSYRELLLFSSCWIYERPYLTFLRIIQHSYLRVNPFLMTEKKNCYGKDDDAVVSSSKYHYRKWIQDTAGDGSKIFLDTRDEGDRYKNGYLWEETDFYHRQVI